MNQDSTETPNKEPYNIVREQLQDSSAELTSFLFGHGANVYVFSYSSNGQQRYTLIDSGDGIYQKQILPLLAAHGIEVSGIERIILTHRHPDHCGLAALLASKSGAKVLVHPSFKSVIDGGFPTEQRIWLDRFDPCRLKQHVEYLPEPKQCMNIGGVDFPILGKPMAIGEKGALQIMGCPEIPPTHSPDQLVIIYSPHSFTQPTIEKHDGFRPTDDIIFAGDLWLMRGPLHGGDIKEISRHLRMRLYRARHSLFSKERRWPSPQEQDTKAKEALKNGFSLIRVKPGHGDEFIGSQIIPRALLAERDLLTVLGYSMNADKAILKSKENALRIASLMEQAYANFVNELGIWRGLGYTQDEISHILSRIYREQSGGNPMVQQDRGERRVKLQATLLRLENDETQAKGLRQLAEGTLAELKRIKPA